MPNKSKETPRGGAKPASPPPHEAASASARSREHRRHVEALLDAALGDTFPASDPTAITIDR
ncbi:MAG: hypothetical protein ACLQJR_02900 [Stellaceae bacterium]